MKHAHLLLLLIRAHFILGLPYATSAQKEGEGVIKNPKLGAKDKQIFLRTEAGRGSNNQEILWMSYMEVPFKKISRRHAKFPHCLSAVLLSLSFSLSFHLNKEFRNFSPLPSSFRAPRDDRDSFK